MPGAPMFTPLTRLGAADFQIPDIPPWYRALSAAGTVVGAYHGWKRDESVGWTIGWALLGGIFPFIVIPLAFAQGIDAPAHA